MTIQEAYKRFLLKINKNDTNDEVRISPAEFVLGFNEASLNWLGNKIKQKNSTDDINDLYELLVEDEELPIFKESKKYNEFLLPDNFFKFVNATAIAEKGNCEKDLSVYNIKPKDKDSWLTDEMNNPSFEWEETISILTNKSLQVFKKDFEVTGVNLSYYRKPISVDIEGYINVDEIPSKTVHPDLSDENVNEIINRLALSIDLNYKNPESAQLNSQRIITE